MSRNIKFYNRFGFKSTVSYGIRSSWGVLKRLYENIRVCELKLATFKEITGIVEMKILNIKYFRLFKIPLKEYSKDVIVELNVSK